VRGPFLDAVFQQQDRHHARRPRPKRTCGESLRAPICWLHGTPEGRMLRDPSDTYLKYRLAVCAALENDQICDETGMPRAEHGGSSSGDV
jgi:hypothetical protein